MKNSSLSLFYIILIIVFVAYTVLNQSSKDQKNQCVNNEKFYSSGGKTYLCKNWNSSSK